MKHEFLLDENVIYHAVRGVDAQDRPDTTAAELIGAIGRICHVITIHTITLDKYWDALQRLLREPPRAFHPVRFIKEFMNNSEKRRLEYDELPKLPPGVTIPRKDEWIVQAALISRPIVVTADDGLREAITKAEAILGLSALDPHEALDFARQNPAT